MFFPVSKVFWLIAEPAAALVLVAALGVALAFTRWARTGRRLSAAAMLGLLVILFTPLGAALLRPLENRFPPPSADFPAPTGIIVLGGGLDEAKSEARGQTMLSGDGMRLIAGLQLARRYPTARLIFTGGSGNFLEQAPSEATGVQKFWLDLGEPGDRMSFESKSRNTWENALFTRDLVKPKPGETWLLVTSAWHMPRSMGIFRRVGFNVTAYPVAYRTFGDDRDWWLPVSASDRISTLDLAIREWIGLLAYRLTHKTNALFPAP
ncbi:MAG: YdcF family protein [Methylocella sp.]